MEATTDSRLTWEKVQFAVKVRNTNTYRLTKTGTITKACKTGPPENWTFQVKYNDGKYGSGYKNPDDFVTI